jgi:putative ABC transport system ATP-binding protein
MIELNDVWRTFTADSVRTHALRHVSLSVAQGEFAAIMGPSGCGKSTLLSILGLLDAPTSGSYRLMGRNVASLGDAEAAQIRRESIGYVFQEFALIDDLTVEQNLEVALIYQRVPRALRKKLCDEALERFGVAHRRRHKPSALSGGQKQRVAIARAVITPRAIVLADEPTGNLDSANGQEVLSLLRGLADQGTTIVMVTHSIEHARNADRVLQMLDGQLFGDENPRLPPGAHEPRAVAASRCQ